ncbi:CMGC protein kinase [Fusarium oxysporum f. sp. conglutinans race 2 54008]|uniref:CMGC protein kinase n=2 Tax=Fusarium oxysporum TaxID=5507 RepID=X0L2T7_FUSOX|nr:CMGC protein kinase [Fusarium oxysporum f. sp. conglutinans race 2 54008]EXM20168.1 CMGC protein kinase [Fusarium oxysporum f. sp. vasinfectum 25433]
MAVGTNSRSLSRPSTYPPRSKDSSGYRSNVRQTRRHKTCQYPMVQITEGKKRRLCRFRLWYCRCSQRRNQIHYSWSRFACHTQVSST